MEKDDIETLARWWNTLNNWEWPTDMPGKPDGFDDAPDMYGNHSSFVEKMGTKYMMSKTFLNEIQKFIGTKECLRHHHVHNLNKTNEEFEMWWDINGRGIV